VEETIYEYKIYQNHTPTEFDLLGGIWPLKVGTNVAKPKYHIGPQVLKHFSLHFVTSGRVLLTYENKQIMLEQGDIFAIYPNVLHQYQNKSITAESSLKMHWLAFNGPKSTYLMNRIKLKETRPFLKNKLNQELQDTLQKLQHSLSKISRFNKQQLLLHQLLYQVFYLLEDSTNHTPTQKQSSLIFKSLDFIQKHFKKQIKIQDIAKHVGLSRSHFSKLFTETLGETPGNYIIKKRMELSLLLLSEQQHTITEIAITVGYPNVYTFSRAFKVYYGQSPSYYYKSLN